MSITNAFTSVDMSSMKILAGAGSITKATASQIQVTDSSGNVENYYSSDASFTFNGANVTGGHLTGIDYLEAGTKVYMSNQWVGVSITTAFELINQNKLPELFSLVLGGKDIFNGSDSKDLLMGLNGNDILRGGGGDDVLDGGTGDNRLYGDAGADTLLGESGADVLDGGIGVDVLKGGAGNDVYFVDNSSDVVLDSSVVASEIDIVRSTASFTLGANLERLILLGTSVANGAGNALDNILTGNNGANVLNGGGGKDMLTGGMGADTFAFSNVSDSGSMGVSRDLITDFKSSQNDKVDLSAIDANAMIAGNNTFNFTTGGVFSGVFAAAGELYFDQQNHVLYLNTDADISADSAIILAGVNILAASDLIL